MGSDGFGTKKAAKWRPYIADVEILRPAAGSIVDMVAMVMMIAISMRDIWPCHVADRASCDRPDGPAYKSACPSAHQPIIQPLPSCRLGSRQSNARKKHGNKKCIGHSHNP